MSQKIGPYDIIRRLAQGGMAEVMLARQTSMGGFERLVCIKRILPHLSAQEDFLKMFQDEARIAANLVHPNIAQIYDISRDGDDTFIAMEYVRGEDLRRVYNQEVSHAQTIAPHIAAQICMGAAAGLDYAHRQTGLDGKPLGIVHRDISPQNLLVTYDGFVKIIDFGVAKAANKLIETRSGVLKGKYSYMSPEQASGERVDGRSDIFALGITLYEVTCGTRLFKRENELETLQAVIACKVPPPGEVVAGYDPQLEAVVMRALAHDPKDRYSAAGEMERDLESFLRAQGRSHGSSTLAAYMQDLFADKLADEALFGGQPWEGSNTAQGRPRPAESKIDNLLAEVTEPDRIGDGPGPTAAAAATSDWEPERMVEEQTQAHDFPQTVPGSEIWPPQAAQASPPTLPMAPQPEAAQPTVKPGNSALGTALPPAKVRSPQRVVGLLVALGLVAGGVGVALRRRGQPAAPPAAPVALPDMAPVARPGAVVDLPEAGHAAGALSIESPLALQVFVDGHFVGETPTTGLPLAPGTHRLTLRQAAEGLTLAQSVHITTATTHLIKVDGTRGELALRAHPWAWVKLGERVPFETPNTLSLVAGDYQILFECPEGERREQRARVVAGSTTTAQINCP